MFVRWHHMSIMTIHNIFTVPNMLKDPGSYEVQVRRDL
jgi:hypothetical protein